ncbi:hypothetical protein HCN44_005920 [Aphidius gifuensis]|uniref:Nucleolar protein 58 n=1 Tax=Aphidius gifuensis TaxID=684658 RepID=A0A835CRR7_APHGI|nr:hypothetical protein HCN44_005920 [Aphidius gifuensis]
MLVLFETPAGYAIFKLLNEKKLEKSENLYEDFITPESATALEATTAATEGTVCKALKKLLKKHCDEQLAVADAKLGNAIKEKLSLTCVSNTAVQELMRCIRSQSDSLLVGLEKKEMTAMALGLAHSLSRYKLKFSPDKIDTMIVQAVCLLDDIDKELNNYVMRAREWYGWHFPELGKIITDNVAFVKTIKVIGTRDNAISSDLSDILPEEVEEKIKEAAEISMGTEISIEDIMNIQNLCDQIIDLSQYRAGLYDYLKARMMAMAPNVTVLVGELVGARLISHSGSLINLAKQPASTVQILGAEKALFRALKTKRDTPKYGLIYHAQLVGQASTKNKGKMSRMLAAKVSLATRVDALGDDVTFELGAEHKAKLESRLRMLEQGNMTRLSGTAKAKAKFEKYHSTSEHVQYPAAADSTVSKRTFDQIKTESEEEPAKKKKKHQSDPDVSEVTIEDTPAEPSQKKKKKKKNIKQEEGDDEVFTDVTVKAEIKTEVKAEAETEAPTNKKKKKKQKIKTEDVKVEAPEEVAPEAPTSEKKKKKKKKSQSND